MENNKQIKIPLWLGEKNSINEVIFCEDFVSTRPLKCINGRFYSIDREISDNFINYEIAMKLTIKISIIVFINKKINRYSLS